MSIGLIHVQFAVHKLFFDKAAFLIVLGCFGVGACLVPARGHLFSCVEFEVDPFRPFLQPAEVSALPAGASVYFGESKINK